MKIKLIIALLVFTGVSMLHAQSLDIPLITVQGSETSYAQVDEIHFSLTIQTYAKAVSDARNKNRQIAELVFKHLANKKVPKQYIQTKRMRISRNYTRNKHPVTYDGFNAYQTVYVCLKDLNAYDEIVDALLLMEIHSISGPEFKSSLYEKTMQTTRLKALKKARVNAEEMAAALGQKIGKAKLVTTVRSNNNNGGYNTQSSAASDFQSTNSSFEVGEIEVTATVEVAFELLE